MPPVQCVNMSSSLSDADGITNPRTSARSEFRSRPAPPSSPPPPPPPSPPPDLARRSCSLCVRPSALSGRQPATSTCRPFLAAARQLVPFKHRLRDNLSDCCRRGRRLAGCCLLRIHARDPAGRSLLWGSHIPPTPPPPTRTFRRPCCREGPKSAGREAHAGEMSPDGLRKASDPPGGAPEGRRGMMTHILAGYLPALGETARAEAGQPLAAQQWRNELLVRMYSFRPSAAVHSVEHCLDLRSLDLAATWSSRRSGWSHPTPGRHSRMRTPASPVRPLRSSVPYQLPRAADPPAPGPLTNGCGAPVACHVMT